MIVSGQICASLCRITVQVPKPLGWANKPLGRLSYLTELEPIKRRLLQASQSSYKIQNLGNVRIMCCTNRSNNHSLDFSSQTILIPRTHLWRCLFLLLLLRLSPHCSIPYTIISIGKAKLLWLITLVVSVHLRYYPTSNCPSKNS